MDQAVTKSERSLTQYEQHYSWSHPLGDHCIAHKDGAVSIMILWDGVDTELLSNQQKLSRWASFYLLLNSLSPEYCIEAHFWREQDSSLAARYLAKNREMVRAVEFATHIRENHARHLSQYSRRNTVAFTLTRLPASNPFALFAKKNLTRQSMLARELEVEAGNFARGLEGARLATHHQYRQSIVRSFDRSVAHESLPEFNPQLLLTEQVINEAPTLDQGMVKMGERYTKVLLLYLYPDSSPAWFSALAAVPADIHVSQIILPTDTLSQMNQAEREQDMVEGMASNRGRYTTAKGLSDLASYQKLIADENLSIFRNAYIIHVHGQSPEHINSTVDDIRDWVVRERGVLKQQDYIQLPYFRAAQPGQGYRCPSFRPDHTWQVADMLPVEVYRQGSDNPESLRLGVGSQLVGFNLSDEAIAHSFTVAMTGAGKGVDKGATIIETYPFGIDWYIAEIGESYRWTVESLGGDYTTIDPDHDVVNPLPPYRVADPDPDYGAGELPLNAKIVGGTVKALGFLLSGGKSGLDQHQRAAAQLVLQAMYIDTNQSEQAPTLFDYFQTISNADFFENKQQSEAAKTMAANLESFLSTAEGRLFKKQDNLILSEGITGVNLKDVKSASEELLQFYLVFLSLRYSQLAFFRPNNSRILLDEMHEFVNTSPEVIGSLISAVSRMGRKDAGFIDLVTQGIREIDVIEEEVLNSMPLRTLLYRPDGHEAIASRITMPEGILPIWKAFPYPEKLPYRPGLRSVGDDWFNLHLTFSKDMLALVDTSQLARKKQIASQTTDPLERIALFYRGTES